MSDYTIERNNRQSRVVLAGDLTASSVGGLQAALKTELNAGVDEVAFDLSKTVMLDSSGIGLLIAAHNSLTRTRGKVSVQNVSPQILQLLQTMRLVSRLNVNARQSTEEHHG